MQNNIEQAENNYNAQGEEVLISYLEDEDNSTYDRTNLAVWNLGKIRSEKRCHCLINII